jgi:serine/threonine protein kinase
MEHAQSGDLFDFSLKLKQPMGESLAKFLFK